MELREPSTESNYSLGAILRDLRDQAATLVRQEAALARAEVSEKAGIAGRNLGFLLFGALFAFAGFVILLMAAVKGTELGLVRFGQEQNAPWLAPLIVGGLVTLIGLAFVQKAKATLKRTTMVPERTVNTMKESQQWLATKVS